MFKRSEYFTLSPNLGLASRLFSPWKGEIEGEA